MWERRLSSWQAWPAWRRPAAAPASPRARRCAPLPPRRRWAAVTRRTPPTSRRPRTPLLPALGCGTGGHPAPSSPRPPFRARPGPQLPRARSPWTPLPSCAPDLPGGWLSRPPSCPASPAAWATPSSSPLTPQDVTRPRLPLRTLAPHHPGSHRRLSGLN